MIHRFGAYELDTELFELRRGGKVKKIEPKVFDVLRHLLEHRDRVVPKAELLDTLWPGETVSESVLPRCIAAARRALADDRSRQRVIQTVHGRGYRFVAELGEPARARPEPEQRREDRPLADGTIVGREEALSRIGNGLDAAEAGRGRLLLLVGEPGIGKTRTAEAAGELARARGLTWWNGRCYEGRGAPAFWPFVQILRACLESEQDDDALRVDLGAGAADTAELVPELRERLPDLAAPEESEGSQARFRLFDAVSRWLRRRSARAPLVLFLDDLHWADPDSILLLEFLVESLAHHPILILGTYRDVEVRRDHPLAAALGALARLEHCERIPLRGLGRDEVAQLIEEIAGEPGPRSVVETVLDMTGGNPFFVREVVRLLTEQGNLGDARDRSSLALPQSVRDAVGRRLDSLSPECNQLLRVGAVLGREFGSAQLARVTERDPEEILELLGEALTTQIIEESRSGVGRYTFQHALIRQTLYEELSVPERVRLHREVARALDVGSTAGEPDWSQLAHHYYEAAPAGDVDRAIEVLAAAADQCERRHAYDEAAATLRRALELLALASPVDAMRDCELRTALGEAYTAAGERERANASYREAASGARRLERPDLMARAAMGLRGPAEKGHDPGLEITALLEEALASQPEDATAMRARLLADMTGTPPHCLSMQTRQELSLESLRLAEASGDLAALRAALFARYWATLGPDRIDERREVAAEIGRRANERGDAHLRMLGFEAAVATHLIVGELDDVDRLVAEHHRVAVELRMPMYLFISVVMQASAAMNRGRFAEAERLFDEAREHGHGVIGYAEAVHTGTGYWLRAMRGDAVALGGSLEFFREIEGPYFSGLQDLIHVGLGLALWERGDEEGARRELATAMPEGSCDLNHDEHWLITMDALASLTHMLDDKGRAALLYDALLPYESLFVTHDLLRGVFSSVPTCLGRLAGVLGRYDTAIQHLEAGVAALRTRGLRPSYINALRALEQAFRARGEPGDRARSARCAEEAGAMADEIGMGRNRASVLPF